MAYQSSVGVGVVNYRFADLRELLAKATPLRAGDQLAGLAADSTQQRIAACQALADLPLITFVQQAVVPQESDAATRLLIDGFDASALAALTPGLTPEMAAAVSKLMRNQDLILVVSRCRVGTRFRSALGLPGHLAERLQPNHPSDRPAGIVASILDGLM